MGMRQGRDNGLLKDGEGRLVGINLGSDYCAEHEWGIKTLKELFGMRENKHGLEKRTITKIPGGRSWFSGTDKSYVRLIDTKKHTVLLVGESVNDETFDIKHTEVNRGNYNCDKLITAWCEKSLGINAATEEDRQAVRELYGALQNKDLAVWLGGGRVFKNAGLVMAIASRVPADGAQAMYDADTDQEKLEKAANKTGITARLEKAEKRYFALSPRWRGAFDSDKGKPSKYEVIFWLNPMEQNRNNYGWFTVEELDQWIAGEGPVPKTERVA